MYRVECEFHLDFRNPVTGSDRGHWRVTKCYTSALILAKAVVVDGGILIIESTKYYRPGTFIKPHREINRVLSAYKELYEQYANRSGDKAIAA